MGRKSIAFNKVRNPYMKGLNSFLKKISVPMSVFSIATDAFSAFSSFDSINTGSTVVFCLIIDHTPINRQFAKNIKQFHTISYFYDSNLVSHFN